IRNYGQKCTTDGNSYGLGFPANPAPSYPASLDHIYWHDLVVDSVNKGCDLLDPASGTSNYIVWSNFTGGLSVSYETFENINVINWGGYLFRGSSAGGPRRFQHISATAFPSTNNGAVVAFKPWGSGIPGAMTGFDILDSVFDSKAGVNYTPSFNSGTLANTAIEIVQCTQDAVVRNNT